MTDATRPRIAFIQAGWHREIVEQARRGFLETAGTQATVDVFEVPGSFELPLHAKLLAETGRYQAVVAAGFVVDGGIYRHDFVAHAVVSGLMRVQLDTGIPVFSAVLTPQRFHDHHEHRAFFHAHMEVKGREAATTCLATLDARAALAPIQASDAAHALFRSS